MAKPKDDNPTPTLHDQFAMAALAALPHRLSYGSDSRSEMIAAEAWELADQMMAQRHEHVADK